MYQGILTWMVIVKRVELRVQRLFLNKVIHYRCWNQESDLEEEGS